MKFFLSLFLFFSTVFSAVAQIEVAIISMNDFHAGFVRNDYKGQPGAAAILHTVDSLKKVYPAHVVVAGGDNFGGSYFYQSTHGALLPVFYDRLGITLSALGNHEFDEGQRALAEKWSNVPERPKDWDITYLSANVRSLKTGRIPRFAAPVASVPVALPGGGKLRVAFLGLTTAMTPQQTSVRRLGGLTFDGRYDEVIDSVMRLPEASLIEDATIRILLTHIGTGVDEDGLPFWDDRDGERLEELEDKQWHGVVSAHTHQQVAGYIGDLRLPVVQGGSHGRCLGMLLCRVDTLRKRVISVTPRLVEVIPPAHLSPRAAKMEAAVDSLLQSTLTAGGTPLGEYLMTLPRPLIHSRDHKTEQTEVGTLVCRSYAEAYRRAAQLGDEVPVIGCSHFGSIRASLPAGKITVLDIGEALPFANRLKAYSLTGEEITRLVAFGIHNERFGRIQTGNLRIVTNANEEVTALIYQSPEGRCSVLHPKKRYILVADEFMTTGGDGYDPQLFPEEKLIKEIALPMTTDAFITYLKHRQKL